MDKANINYYFSHIDEFPVKTVFDDCVTAGDVLRNSRVFFEKELPEMTGGKQLILGDVHESAVITGVVYVGAGTKIGPTAVIEGPVYIGENCTVAAGAYIRPRSLIGDRCGVGHASEVKNTVMQNGSKVASLAFAGDSILGKSARVGSGVILANRKFNQSDVGVKIDGVYHDMKTDFFGCVLGDSSRVGANCATLPGTHIGPYSWVLPGTVAKGFIPAETRVASAQQHDITQNERVELK